MTEPVRRDRLGRRLVRVYRRRPIIERFLESVRRDSDTGCLIWTRFKDADGYGLFKPRSFSCVRAHRLAFELVHGSITPGMMVLHSCHNPSCVEPDHLREGTHSDNMRDRAATGWRLPADVMWEIARKGRAARYGHGKETA